jgi:F420-dependent oxidoreductase-like protein
VLHHRLGLDRRAVVEHMKLALQAMRPTTVFGAWASTIEGNIRAVRFAERLGYDSVWTAEAAGTDAFLPLAWIAARTDRIKLGTGIVPLSSRPPTVTAMSAATLDRFSGGRFILGLGTSGPAIVEGWHGARFDAPLERTREYVRIVREVLGRRTPRRVAGAHYPLPHPEASEEHPATARLMFRPTRPDVPLYLAALGTRNIRMATEIADGVIPAFYSPAHEKEFFDGIDSAGIGDAFELAPFVAVSMADDTRAAILRLKPAFAFWLGGMGSGSVNFYGRYVERLGFTGFADRVKHLFRAGYRTDAAAAIPDEFVDAVALCGPRERIAERLVDWRSSRVTTMILNGVDKQSMQTMAELVL